MLKARYDSNAKTAALITASLATVAAGLLGFVRVAHAQWAPSGTVAIENENRSNACMGVSYGIMQPNQPVIQWDCESIAASPDQFWTFVYWGWASFAPGNGSLYEIVNNKDPSYCLEGDGHGEQLVVNPCSSGTTVQWGQFWQVYNDGFAFTRLYNPWTGLVAAVAAASTSDAAAIILWEDQTGGVGAHAEQLWAYPSANPPPRPQ